MENRKDKIKKLLENFGSLRRHMIFHSAATKNTPRITPSQWGALMVIDKSEEITTKEMAANLGITSSATTQLVDGLVASGYVVRKTHNSDRRATTLTLSKKTKAKVQEKKKMAQKKFLKLFEALNDTELSQYLLLNEKIVDRFLKKN